MKVAMQELSRSSRATLTQSKESCSITNQERLSALALTQSLEFGHNFLMISNI